MNPVEEMCRSYLELAEVREVQKDDCIVTLPVLDRFNDWMSVRVSISSGICRISDMGFVADDLSSAGIGYVPGGNSRYDSMISLISSNTMCRFDEAKREFYAECNVADMGSRMMYFLQGISHLDFMAYNTQGFIPSRRRDQKTPISPRTELANRVANDKALSNFQNTKERFASSPRLANAMTKVTESCFGSQ